MLKMTKSFHSMKYGGNLQKALRIFIIIVRVLFFFKTKMTHQEFMQEAIELSRENMRA